MLSGGECLDHPYTLLLDRKGSWTEAYTMCAAMGQRLLAVASDEEVDLVRLYMEQAPKYP